MPGPDLIEIFVSRINRLESRYMLTGSLAAVLYGEPRLTHDVDIVIELALTKLNDFLSIFPEDQYSVPPLEVVRIEVQRPNRGHCNVIHFESGLKADLYFMGKDPLHLWAMQHRRDVTIASESIWIAPPEYVIIKKLAFYKEGGSEKHLRDIRLMLEHSSSSISFPFIKEQVTQLGLSQEWHKAQGFIV